MRFRLRAWIGVVLALLCGCQEPIIHNLDEDDANKIITRLHKVPIVAEKIQQADGKWAIRVNQNKVVTALQYLQDTRAFREIRPRLRGSPSILKGKRDQLFHFERSLSEEIEYTLATLHGVLEARVHINLPGAGGGLNLSRSKTKDASASVLLITLNEFIVNENEVRSLIAGAAGVPEDKIAVLITDGESEEQSIVRTPSSGIEPSKEWANFFFSGDWQLQLILSILIVSLGSGYIYRSHSKK